MSRKDRIEQERKNFNEWKSSISCSGDPKEGDNVWNVIMNGPKDSCYKGGKFKIRITFTDGYPTESPQFEFLTPICHININGTHICIDSLNHYKSTYSITDILSQIFMILVAPNEQSAYSKYIKLYRDDYSGYFAEARRMTREYAI